MFYIEKSERKKKEIVFIEKEKKENNQNKNKLNRYIKKIKAERENRTKKASLQIYWLSPSTNLRLPIEIKSKKVIALARLNIPVIPVSSL